MSCVDKVSALIERSCVPRARCRHSMCARLRLGLAAGRGASANPGAGRGTLGAQRALGAQCPRARIAARQHTAAQRPPMARPNFAPSFAPPLRRCCMLIWPAATNLQGPRSHCSTMAKTGGNEIYAKKRKSLATKGRDGRESSEGGVR